MLRRFIFTVAALTMLVAGFSAMAASAAPNQYPPSSVPVDVSAGNQSAGNQGAGNQGTGANGGSRTGALPRTGSDLQPFVLVGLALVAGGAFMLVTVNRRRGKASA